MGNRYHILEPRFFCCSDIFLSLFFHARYKLVINNLFVNLSNIAIYAARASLSDLSVSLFGLDPFRPARHITRQMSLSLSKTELAFIQGSREFTKEQARVLRYRINKKLKNQAKTDTDNQNQQLEHSSAVFGTVTNPFIKG